MKIIIMGNPIPAARPRVTHHHTYNPKAVAQEKLSFEIKAQLPPTHMPSIQPIELTLFFFMQIPKSLSAKKKKSLMGQPHCRKPDIDNLAKMILDAASGVLYKDDSQVYEIASYKIYSEKPRTEINILEYK